MYMFGVLCWGHVNSHSGVLDYMGQAYLMTLASPTWDPPRGGYARVSPLRHS